VYGAGEAIEGGDGGKRFYASAVMVVCWLAGNAAVAFFLFGLALHRRGHRRTGRIMSALAALAMMGLLARSARLSQRSATSLMTNLSAAMALGLMGLPTAHQEA
jgi:hypothetical protein